MAFDQNAVAQTNPAQSPGLASAQTLQYDFSGTTQYLFNRAWEIEIGTPGAPGLKYTQLRTIFEIEKTSFALSNKAKISLYNLSDLSRSRIGKGLQLTLKAGYQGLLHTIFAGNISGRVKTERKEGDLITAIECGEGEKSITQAIYDQTYPAMTPVSKVVKDLVAALGLPLGPVRGLNGALVYSNGFHVTGLAGRTLSAVLASQGLVWSVQNGAVQIYQQGLGAITQGVAVNQNTGLIGVPSNGAAGDGITTFTSLLNPRIMPGVPVILESELFSGTYEVQKAKFEGDSHGAKWQVSCEAQEIRAGSSLVV